MNSSAFDAGSASRFVSLAHIESLKWVAVVAMLIEHYYRYVVGAPPDWAFSLGRIVLPLFALSLGAGLAAAADETAALRRVVARLGIWFALVTVVSLPVRDALPLNVLGTLALGLLFREALLQRAWIPLLAILVASVPFEFGPAGVLCVALLVDGAAGRGRWMELCAGFGCAVLASMSFAPLLAVLVIALVQGFDLRLPRVRHAFYWVYALQFPAFWLMAGAT